MESYHLLSVLFLYGLLNPAVDGFGQTPTSLEEGMKTAGLLLQTSKNQLLAQAAPRSGNFIDPPVIHSKEQIAAWIQESLEKINPEIRFELMNGKDWSNYVNFHHFVPLTYDGVPPNHRFDFSWIEDRNKRDSAEFPTAEVTETGKFTMWWNFCNFFEMPVEKCRDYIHGVTAHEAGHFRQWQTLATTAIEQVWGNKPSKVPTDLAQLEQILGAREVFMKKWTDGPHYQCREVEVYTAQILKGEISNQMLNPPFLEQLYMYYSGCNNSQWRDEFKVHLENAEAVFASRKRSAS